MIPVGFDVHRLTQPTSVANLELDRVVLFYSAEGAGTETASELIDGLVDQVKNIFVGAHADVEVYQEELALYGDNILYDFNALYEFAYNRIEQEVDEGHNVYVNISSMPRTVSFGFASAANSLIFEHPEYRDLINIYYSAPDNYLLLDAIEVLRELDESDLDLPDDLADDVNQTLEDIEQKGATEGVHDEEPFVSFPIPPEANVSQFGGMILQFLYESDESTDSRSSLADSIFEELSEKEMENYVESKDENDDGDAGDDAEDLKQKLRQRVLYHTDRLLDQGYLKREKVGNRDEIELTTRGELWARTHQ